MRAVATTVAQVALVSLGTVAAFASPAAAAPRKPSTKNACLAAHEEGLALRTQKKPHAAHDSFVSCARSECSVVIRKECAEQLALAEKDAPTVALEARDEAGLDAPAVKVTMDGAPLTERLTGTAVDVEPGEHVFHFLRADGKAIDQRVLVVEGDKNRKVLADFATLVKATGPEPAKGPPPLGAQPIPIASFALAGVAVVGLGSFMFFALSGKSTEHDLASSCGPRCSDDEVSPVKTKYATADVSLFIGIAAAAVAVVLAVPAITGGPAKTARVVQTAPPWMPRVTMRSRL